MSRQEFLLYSIFFGRDGTGAIVLTHSGHEVLMYTGPYAIVGALIYVLYGVRNSKLRLAQKPLAGDAAFVTKPHEKRTD